MIDLIKEFTDYLFAQGFNKISVRNYASDLNKFFTWFRFTTGKDIASSSIKILHLSQFENYLKSNNIPDSSIRRYMATLKKFYNWISPQEFIFPAKIPLMPIDSQKELNDNILWDNKLVQEYSNFLTVSGLSKISVRNYLSDISRFIRWFENIASTFSPTLLEVHHISQYDQYLKENNIPENMLEIHKKIKNSFDPKGIFYELPLLRS